jgi:biopolymer transport protein ExbD
MAEMKRRFLDVWITESNTVYREVPYTVVVDWIQQGRLAADDQLRWSGQAQWFRLGGVPSFSAYLPRSEPMRADDQAEALERVEVDFAWKRRPEDDDDEVDMIPLIDVSLVLLIFFILTAAGITATTAIATPFAKYGDLLGNKDMLWVGIDREDGQPVYSVGVEDDTDKEKIKALEEDKHLKTLPDLLQRVDAMLLEAGRPMKVNIKANKDMPTKEVRRVMVELEKRRRVILDKYLGVSETGE